MRPSPDTAIADVFLRSKVRSPKGEGLLPRPSVRLALESALTHPVVVVSAPAGYGKTSTLADWAKQAGPVAWLSLDTEDDDPVRFWTGVARSCQVAWADHQDNWTALLEATKSFPGNPSSLAALALEALEQVEGLRRLVWDDVHELRDPGLLGSLTKFLGALPENTTVVLACRVDPPLPLARWRLEGILGDVRIADLRVQDAEGAMMLGRWCPALGVDLVQLLLAKLEGWPAGLRLTALALGKTADPVAFVRQFSGNQRLILEYLTEEVLARQPEDLREFLLVSAVFDRWCPALLDALGMFEGQAEALTHQVEHAELFLVPLGEGGWFRYHHLFAEALRARLRIKDPGRDSQLWETAAPWFETQGDQHHAFDLWWKAGRGEEAARCLKRVDYLARGELTTLSGRLKALGDLVLQQHPELADLSVWVRFFEGRRDEALARATVVEGWSKGWTPAESVRSEGNRAALTAFDAHFMGLMDLATKEALRADTLLSPQEYYPRSIVSYVLGCYHRDCGQLDEADRQFARITELGEALGSIWTISQGYYEQGILAFHRADLCRAENRCMMALDRAERLGAGHYGTLGRVRALLANLQYERGEFDAAERTLEPLVTHPSGLGIAYLEAQIVQIQIEVARGGDRGPQMLKELEEVRLRSRPIPRIAAQIDALGLVMGGRDQRPTGPTGPLEDLILDWAWARHQLDRGEFSAAWSSALDAEVRARAGGWKLWEIRLGALGAWAARLGRLEDPGRLDQIRKEAGKFGLVMSLVDGNPEAVRSKIEPRVGISPREAEVLGLLAQGLGNRDIAERLFISEATVKTHVHHLATQFAAPNRASIVVRAREQGLLRP